MLNAGCFKNSKRIMVMGIVLLSLVGMAQVPEAWTRARVLKGAWGDGCGSAEGVCELKCGKASKTGMAKISLKITPFIGKKKSYSSVSVAVPETGPVTVRWAGRYEVTIQEDGSFFGEPIYGDVRPCCSPDSVWSAEIGGPISGRHCLWVPEWYDCLDYDDYYNVDGTSGTEYDFLYCTGLWQKYEGGMCVSSGDDIETHPFSVVGSKWIFDHEKMSHWGDPSYNANVPKVTYNSKTGLLKGTYKIAVGPYCMDLMELRPPRVKTYSLKINGACFNGMFYGVMTYKMFSTPFYGE